ncbi:alpha/beta hydrolase [Roseibium sp.]|uniref:alpha/beta hydrolase n=1 Tax=Roseibium sp. TaxID=1936156 RepID=UPI003BA98E17
MNDLTERDLWNPQFRFSDVLEDFDEWLRWRDAASRAAERSLSFERFAYGAHGRQWIETTECGTVQSRVVPVFIHGGYWRSLSAEDHRCVLTGLSSLGNRCANAEYRLMPEFRLDDLVSDAVAAFGRLAELYSGDTRFLLVGHSAGAHLAVSIARKAGLTDRLAGVAAISGVYDLAPVARSFLQDEIGLSDEEIRSHSLIGASIDTPLLCIVGGDETDEFKRQSLAMSESAGAGHLIVRGANHLSILADLNSQKSPLIDALGVWLNSSSHPAEVDTISS